MARTKITDATIKQIKALHGEGLSARKIATKLGISPSTVSEYAKKLKLRLTDGT